MGFDSIRKIMPQAIQAAQIKTQMDAVRVLQLFQKLLISFWGEERAAMVEAVSFADGTLSLSALSGPAAQELKMQQMEFQNSLNRELGGAYVKTIKVFLKQAL